MPLRSKLTVREPKSIAVKTKFTRRKFLKTSTLATAAGLTLPRFFSSASAAATPGTSAPLSLPKLPPIPPLPAIPSIPTPRPPLGSVPLGAPANYPEAKMDFPIEAGVFEPTWDSISKNYPAKDIAWLREAKFGFWVHFGPQSAGQSGDWYARRLYQEGTPAYRNHIRDFGHPSETGYMDVLHKWNPSALDPAALVQLYRDAGARFLIIQGVHHDQFDNWDSKYQPWNSVNLGPKRDILGAWQKAVRAQGMHFGVTFHHDYSWFWYQSAFAADRSNDQNKLGVPYDAARLTLADGVGKWWEGFDPRMLYTVNMREYAGFYNGYDRTGSSPPDGIWVNHQEYARWYATWWALRIMDVVEKYDPDFIYTDGNSTQPFSGDHTGMGYKCDAMQRVLAHYFNHTSARRGKIDTFAIVKHHPSGNGIVNTAESKFPDAIKTDQPWIGESQVGDWFYGPNFIYDPGMVIRHVLECVSRDGAVAICVPIRPDGSLDDGSKTMLAEIGQWMKINGEGIYGSKAWTKLGEGTHRLPSGALSRRQAGYAFTNEDFRFTVGKDGGLYAFCMTVPESGAQLKITSLGTSAEALPAPIKTVSLLGSDNKLTWTQQADGFVITCPETTGFKSSVCFKIGWQA
jgi:alpha-L-fucosidase